MSGSEGPAGASPEREAQAAVREEFGRLLRALTPRVWVVPALVLANLGVFVAMLVDGVDILKPTGEGLVRWGANFGPMTTSGQWWRLASSMFVHIGILHIALNLWALWDAGRLVERLVGNTTFLVLYVVSGLAGSLASLASNPVLISAGASGAIFGVFGALLGFLALRRGSIPAPVLKPLAQSTIVFVLYNLAYGFIDKNIDAAAHMGGLGAGFACGLLVSQPLEPGRGRRRLARAGLLAAVGAAALAAGVVFLPRAAGEYSRILDGFRDVERQSLARYRTALDELKAGTRTAGAVADLLERDLVPTWTGVKTRLEGLGEAPGRLEEQRRKVVAYLQQRTDAWAKSARALRANDPAALMRALEEERKSLELLKSLGAK